MKQIIDNIDNINYFTKVKKYYKINYGRRPTMKSQQKNENFFKNFLQKKGQL